MKFEIYNGSKYAMELIKSQGVRALNPRTMRYKAVNKLASYEVIDKDHTHVLTSDMDLRKEAKQKGLIL